LQFRVSKAGQVQTGLLCDCALYAGQVTYNASKFVEKNTDALSHELNDRAKDCVVTVFRQAFEEYEASSESAGGNRQKSNIAQKLQDHLAFLLKHINATDRHYIRCIKPNREMMPLKMDWIAAVAQLRCSGVVTAVVTSHSAYPDRLKHDVALKLFSFLVQTSSGDETVDSRGRVESLLCTLLGDFRPPQKDGRSMQQAFFCGESQIFLCAGALEHLREISQRKIDAARIQLQSFLRCQVRRFKQDRRAVLVLQCTARCRKAFAGRCNASVTQKCRWKTCGIKRNRIHAKQQVSDCNPSCDTRPDVSSSSRTLEHRRIL